MLNRRNQTELVRKIRAGDEQAFEQLFRAFARALVRFTTRFVLSTETAENIVQDVFVRIWHNRARMDPDLNLKSYLYRACRNQALQHLRHLKIENRDDSIQDVVDPARSPEAAVDVQEIAAAVYAAVAELPPLRRLIFTLSKYDQLTYAEIAEIQKISIKTVETQMGRALKFLRLRLRGLYVKDTQR